MTPAAWFRHLAVHGIRRNAVLSATQTLVTALCLFLIYRILIANHGLEGLGLWSLLLVFSGVTATMDFSGASALARFVARKQHDFEGDDPSLIIHTVLLTSLAINGALVAGLLALAPRFLDQFVSSAQLQEAWSLIPWVVALIVALPLAVGIGASVDGLMRADLRASLGIAAAIVCLAVAWVAIPRMGMAGFGLAQVVQQSIVIVGGWIFLRRKVPGLGWLPWRWRLQVFRKTAGYGIKLNTVGLLGVLFEPLAKFALNFSGGTLAVGSYELAARPAMQIRMLVVSAATPLIPAFAAVRDRRDPALRDMVWRAQSLSSLSAIAMVLLSLVTAPFLCLLMLGHVSPAILQFNVILAFGWGANLFSLPTYLAAQAQGMLRWNMLSHLLAGLGVAGAAILLAPGLGAIGVVLGVGIGLVLGALATVAGNGLTFRFLPFPRRTMALIAAAFVGMIAISGAAWHAAEFVAAALDAAASQVWGQL